MRSRAVAIAIVVALALTLPAGATAAVSPDLVRALRDGGLVLVFRHAATDFSKPDQDPVDITAMRHCSCRDVGFGAGRSTSW